MLRRNIPDDPVRRHRPDTRVHDSLPPSQQPSAAGPTAPASDASTQAALSLAPARHSLVEDIQGLVLASIVSALGMSIFVTGGLMVGGMAGVSLLLHHLTGWSFGLVFVVANLPFYWLSLRRMGWEFTLKTFLAVGVTGTVADLVPRLARYEFITPLYAAVFGGALLGMGVLSFIRHRASLGGVGIMVVWLQQSRGWSAGKLQMGFDAAVMLAALSVLPPSRVLYSALGVCMLNLVLMFNHRPGRYMGV